MVYTENMSLNVKNPDTLSLIDALARRLKTSKAQAINDAVALRLQSLDQPTRPSAEALLQTIWADQTPADRQAVRDRLDNLYDEAGLPA